MKKLLTILLLLTCITMVHAQTDYHILVKGVRVTSANASDVLRDGGSVKYIHAGNRIEFTNANISYGGRALSVESSYEKDLVVKFNGTNVLKNTSTSAAVISFYAPHKLTMYSMNDGSVDINGGFYGVYLGSSSQLSIQDLTCDITSKGYGIYAMNYVDIYSAKVNITTTGAESYGIYHGPTSANNLYIRYNSNVTISTPGEKSYGIYCNSYSTPRIISNATLSIKTSTTATGAFYCEKEAVLSETHFETNSSSVTSNISYNSTLKGYYTSGSALVKTLKILPGTYYNLKVNGKEVTSINASSILGNSTVQYSYSTNTLTLNKANFSATSNAIQLGKSITINVVGTNTITSSGNGIYSTYPFVIAGAGTLNITSTATSNYAPINLFNSPTLTVSGGVTVNLKGSQYGLKYGRLVVNKSVMNIHGDTEAFNSVQGLSFNDSQITDLFYNNKSGMYGNLTLEDGTYKIKYDSKAMKFTNNGTAVSETIQDVAIGYRRLGLRIAGKQVDVNNCNDILGDGTVKYVENGNKLYMTNADIQSTTYAILNETRKEFNVYFSGRDNKLVNTTGHAIESHYNHAPIHIYGDGLNSFVWLMGSDYGIYASDPISISNIQCAVETKASGSKAIYAESGYDISNVRLDITTIGNSSTGIMGYGKIRNESNVRIRTSGSGTRGIHAKWGNVEVSGSTVDISSKEAAVRCDAGYNLVLDPSVKINEVSTDGSNYYSPSGNIGLNNNMICDGNKVCLILKIGPYIVDGIQVAGKQITPLNMNDILGDGTASFDPSTYTLYFDNTTISGLPQGTSAISIVNPGRDVTIVTDNDCRFEGTLFGLYVQGANVTIKGHSLESSHNVYFSGASAGASIVNSSTLTLDNSYSTFYGQHWGLIGLPTCTLNLVNSKCHCYGASQEEDAGSLRDFKQINYDGHTINPSNPAKIINGTAYYNWDNAPIVRASWVMFEPKNSGDADGNGVVDIHDVERIQQIILKGMPYDANADINGDGKITILDIVLLNELLLQNDK